VTERDRYTELRPGVLHTAWQSLKRVGIRRSLAYYFLLQDEKRRYIRSAPDEASRRQRKEIFNRLMHIYRHVLCLHFPLHFVLVSKFMLDLDVPGPIVECGAYKGGSSAQLSVIAKHTSRKLYVCDSFQGLPKPAKTEGHVAIFNGERTHTFREGDYSASQAEVRANIAAYGYPDVCEFVPGFFSDSLPGLRIAPAAIVMDVDLVSSGRDCLKHLWPRLARGGCVFTHEAESDTYLEGLMDPAWWRENLGQCPPLVFGAGSSLSPLAEGLALFRKK